MNIAIIDYPESQKSAVFGLHEMFTLTNEICAERQLPINIQTDVIGSIQATELARAYTKYTAIILPPSLGKTYYRNPEASLKDWLIKQHDQGSILCSACAGSFILAATGLLNDREATTHWKMEEDFEMQHPKVKLNVNKILLNDNDVITAGGMLSWLDLGLELVAQFTRPNIMRQLGKILIVDTGRREQRFYKQFSPKLMHGDKVVLNIQKTLQKNFDQSLKISELATIACLTERTFLRRFSKATGVTPSQYIQQLRTQKASDLLENTQSNIELIANSVGYDDVSAFRKIFVKITGLTPREFRKRFTKN